jgi:hypothetical protein
MKRKIQLTSARDKAVLEFLFSSGLAYSELVAVSKKRTSTSKKGSSQSAAKATSCDSYLYQTTPSNCAGRITSNSAKIIPKHCLSATMTKKPSKNKSKLWMTNSGTDGPHSAATHQKVRHARWHHEKDQPSHAAPFICHRSTGQRRGYASCPGTPRTRFYLDHANLHSPHQPPAPRLFLFNPAHPQWTMIVVTILVARLMTYPRYKLSMTVETTKRR